MSYIRSANNIHIVLAICQNGCAWHCLRMCDLNVRLCVVACVFPCVCARVCVCVYVKRNWHETCATVAHYFLDSQIESDKIRESRKKIVFSAGALRAENTINSSDKKKNGKIKSIFIRFYIWISSQKSISFIVHTNKLYCESLYAGAMAYHNVWLVIFDSE